MNPNYFNSWFKLGITSNNFKKPYDAIHAYEKALEINPNHDIIKKLVSMRKGKFFDDTVLLLYEQALLQEGVKLENPAGFVKRLNKLMEKSL